MSIILNLNLSKAPVLFDQIGLKNADDRQVNDNVKMEEEEAAAVYIALFVNASIRFRNSSRKT